VQFSVSMSTTMEKYWLADGFHRLHAANRANHPDRCCSSRDAVLTLGRAFLHGCDVPMRISVEPWRRCCGMRSGSRAIAKSPGGVESVINSLVMFVSLSVFRTQMADVPFLATVTTGTLPT